MSKIKKTLQVIDSLREVANSLEELIDALQASEALVEQEKKAVKHVPTFEEVRGKIWMWMRHGTRLV